MSDCLAEVPIRFGMGLLGLLPKPSDESPAKTAKQASHAVPWLQVSRHPLPIASGADSQASLQLCSRLSRYLTARQWRA